MRGDWCPNPRGARKATGVRGDWCPNPRGARKAAGTGGGWCRNPRGAWKATGVRGDWCPNPRWARKAAGVRGDWCPNPRGARKATGVRGDWCPNPRGARKATGVRGDWCPNPRGARKAAGVVFGPNSRRTRFLRLARSRFAGSGGRRQGFGFTQPGMTRRMVASGSEPWPINSSWKFLISKRSPSRCSSSLRSATISRMPVMYASAWPGHAM